MLKLRKPKPTKFKVTKYYAMLHIFFSIIIKIKAKYQLVVIYKYNKY